MDLIGRSEPTGKSVSISAKSGKTQGAVIGPDYAEWE